jgi:hypothetical protein
MSQDKTIVNKLYAGRLGKKYIGKEVVVMKGEVHILPKDENKARDFLYKLMADNPGVTPWIINVPRPGLYIL